ncbi:hypothetical protein PMG11_00501 [Penicillium brasilianum]|uniref:Uncharacterized protein n=1 Tax=Penicillium brasilianum TaxID=104259 RepID=A0A0F7TCP6_PENBI|nr:hypothetical protein PMG11_00501 [Penicillium brasilianum]
MASQFDPQIVLYDLACSKKVCFSPVVWRIRLLLNYKQIPYKTIFLEFPDIEPTLKALGIESQSTYTVPAIHHVPSNTYMVDSTPIAHFIEATYPEPPVQLMSELGREVEAKARAVVGTTFRNSVMPREINILSPRSQEYFRRTREAILGHPLEDLLSREEDSWNSLADDIRALGELMQTNKADGPFILGAAQAILTFSLRALFNVRGWSTKGSSRGMLYILVTGRSMRVVCRI